MYYKKINIIILTALFFFTSCQEVKKWLGITPHLVEIQQPPTGEIWVSGSYKYDSDLLPSKVLFYDPIKDSVYYINFPNKEKIGMIVNDYTCTPVEERFIEGGVRFGKTSLSKVKEGKWLSGDAGFDEKGNVYAKGGIWKEEYFKNGLRDSIFKQFDGDGKIIYETTFKMGTGLWKEFHSNGKIYFEIATKGGYFTDTLRLHDYNGNIVGKRLYLKDSLMYSEGLPCFPYRPESVPSD
jgi:hypothetical protein